MVAEKVFFGVCERRALSVPKCIDESVIYVESGLPRQVLNRRQTVDGLK